MKTTAWYASRYVERFGMHLVPIEPGRKYPKSDDWGNNTLSDPVKATDFYTANKNWGVGVALGPSRMCSLDIDDFDAFRLICECIGIDSDALIASAPAVKGRNPRLLFRMPKGVDLPYQKLNWPNKNDPDGSIHRKMMLAASEAKKQGNIDEEARIRAEAKKFAIFTVLELRSAADGKQRQDVLPPSIHPDTKQPYEWITQPTDDWPEPPSWLLTIWTEWSKFKPQLQAMCPWAVEQEVPERKIKPRDVTISGGVIDAYNNSHSLESSLSMYGYTQIGKRWLSPHSGTNIPGVVPFKKGNNCWIHHASDPLCSEETGHPVAPFDLFCFYEHGGDVKQAVKQAAQQLGLSQPFAVSNKQTVIDQETGEVIGAPPVTEYVGRDTMTPLPWTTSKGKPLKHIDNLREICNRLGINIRYNVIKKEEEILIPNQGFSVDNQANASFAYLLSECSLFNFPTDRIGEFVTYLADMNQYNPVVNWVSSKPWDRQDRLQQLLNTVKSKGANSLKETLIKRWMISAVAAAFSPSGVSASGILVFQGSQYLGKTKWFKSLVPRELDLLKDGMLLRPDDKDSVKQCVSYWLVELGELDSTFRKSDIAALKAFITNDQDVLRRAYARKESTYARRTVFFGSVNPREYLNDPTGNRRYWTIECEELDHSHNIDMQQCWAQVYELWKSGEGYYLTAEEMSMLNSHNDEFMALDPVEERILSELDWESPQTLWRWAQATEIALDCGIERPTRGCLLTLSQSIRKRNGGQHRRSNGKNLLFSPKKKIVW